MTFLWISGWAVPAPWLAEQAQIAFPLANHVAVSPSEAGDALSREKFNVLGGYSLGALWLLMHAKDVPEFMPVVLLAPFFSFIAEDGGGSRMARAQLRLQQKRFRNDAKTAVADFYRRSGLENIGPIASNFNSEEKTALDTELGWLESWRSTYSPPEHWLGFVGTDDPLLDANKLQEKWPAIRQVSGAGHAPGLLLRAAANEFQTKVPR